MKVPTKILFCMGDDEGGDMSGRRRRGRRYQYRGIELQNVFLESGKLWEKGTVLHVQTLQMQLRFREHIRDMFAST